MAFIQSLLKIIQTGMLGIVMSEIVMHTKKIGGAAQLHAASDLMLMLTSAPFEGKSVSGVYVDNSETGKLTIVAYLIMIAVYLYPTTVSIKKLWINYDEFYGPFVKD